MENRKIPWVLIAIIILYLASLVGFWATYTNANHIRDNAKEDFRQNCEQFADTRIQIAELLEDFRSVPLPIEFQEVLVKESMKFRKLADSICK
jgi:hypothetical protein